MSSRRATWILAVLLVLGYGIPLARGYARARRMKAKPAQLRKALRERLAAEPGTFQSTVWLAREISHAPSDSTRRVLLRSAVDPRTYVREWSLDRLVQHFPGPEVDQAVDHYLLDPRENWLARRILLRDRQQLHGERLEIRARALADAQAPLFPPSYQARWR